MIQKESDPQLAALRLLLASTTDEKERKEIQALIERRLAELS